MKKFALFVIMAITSQILFAQTVIRDKEEISGRWTKSGSPYIIKGEAIVPKGSTLTIEPGVIVKGKTGTDYDFSKSTFDYSFIRVKGKLVAEGTPEEWITFTRDGESGFWGIIFFEESYSENLLRYCKIEYGYAIYYPIASKSFYAVISIYKSEAIIDKCVILNCSNTGIHCSESTPIITNNIISKNTAGIVAYDKSTPVITNNTIADNYFGLMCSDNSSPVVKNTILWGNNSAFSLSNSRPKMKYCLIQDNTMNEAAIDDGNNILGKDPLFVNSTSLNYNLQSSSPCIGSGENGLNMGGVKYTAAAKRMDGASADEKR